jgi:hypothetical protein
MLHSVYGHLIVAIVATGLVILSLVLTFAVLSAVDSK